MIFGSNEKGYTLHFGKKKIDVEKEVIDNFIENLRQHIIIKLDFLTEQENKELIANLMPKLFPNGTTGLSEYDMAELRMATNKEIIEGC